MERRDFMRACAGCAIFATAPSGGATEVGGRFYSRARLLDERGEPMRASQIAVGRNYIFHYPFQGTPCFLINLGRPTAQNVNLRIESGATYQWAGGVGPNRSVVAYSAICTHRMTYPTRQISFISYRERQAGSGPSRLNTIHCCSEHSEYDPASGARVVSGPAPQPLSAILLEHERTTDMLYAVGIVGADLYEAFFDKYGLKLELDYGNGRARQSVAGSTVVAELANFCKQQVRC